MKLPWGSMNKKISARECSSKFSLCVFENEILPNKVHSEITGDFIRVLRWRFQNRKFSTLLYHSRPSPEHYIWTGIFLPVPAGSASLRSMLRSREKWPQGGRRQWVRSCRFGPPGASPHPKADPIRSQLPRKLWGNLVADRLLYRQNNWYRLIFL